MLRSRLPFILLAILLFGTNLLAQDDITNEDDLSRMLSEGDITYEDFVELLSLYEDKVDLNGSDLSELLIVPGVNVMTLDKIEEIRDTEGGYFEDMAHFTKTFGDGAEMFSSFTTVLPPVLNKFKGKSDLYSKFRITDQDEAPYSTMRVDLKGDNFKFDYKVRSEDNEPLKTLYRSITVTPGDHKLVLGNFKHGFGNGLLFKRHFLPTKSIREVDPAAKFFLYPQDGLNNGIYWSYDERLSPGAAFTINDYDSVKVTGGALNVGYDLFAQFEIGAVYSMWNLKDRFSDQEYSNSAGSVYARKKSNNWLYEAEVAVQEDSEFGANLKAYYQRKKYALELFGWTYSKEFAPFFSDGLGNKNKVSYKLTDKLAYSCKHIGESGVWFRTAFPMFENHRFKITQSYWTNEYDESGVLLEGSAYLRKFWKDAKWDITYTYENKMVGGDIFDKYKFKTSFTKSIIKYKLSNKFYFNYRNYISAFQSVYDYDDDPNYEVEIPADDQDIEANKITAYMQQTWDINKNYQLTFREKIDDPDIEVDNDGYFEFLVKQKIKVKSFNFTFEGAYKNYLDDKDDIVDIKARLSIPFGFNIIER